jgi:CRISPR-associated endonuclease/helicase Cas3
MTFSGLYSHPDIPLEVHINNALTILRTLKKENLPLWNKDLNITLEVSLALHDFGKATEYFQRKLKGEKFRGKERNLSNHSLISAIYTFFVLRKFFKENYKYPLIGFYTVANHHAGILRNFSDALRLDEKSIEILQKQTESIDPKKVNTFIENLQLEEKIKNLLKFDKEEFLSFLKEVLDIFDELGEELEEVFNEETLKDFLTVSNLFSLLVDSDKTEAGTQNIEEALKSVNPKVEIPPEVVDEFKRNLKRETPINTLREEAYKEVDTAKLDLKNHFYTLTLPTGLGKTLTGLKFVLKLKEELEKEIGNSVKVIYSLPFLSVIDQNAQVLEKIFKPFGEKILVKHHHLSLGEYLKEEEDKYEQTRLLVEAWNAPIVITTFVQLFESLIPFKNSTARRHNKFANSVVLIDEVQALPSEFWYLLREYLKEFAEINNTYFVFMTATQPYLVDKGKELIQNKEKFFSAVNRYRVELNLEEQTLEEFFQNFEPKEGKSYLFILNTVESSKKAYKLLLEKGISEGQLCYLSTALTPYDRRRKIEDIRKGKCRFAVTTQLVEAGVDIDFSVVIRDFAPLDSLIQSAGRCNRNFRIKEGVFKVLNLVNEKGKRYSSRIYDIILLQITEKLLKEFQPKDEKELINLSDRFYKEVWNSKSRDKSKELLNRIRKLEFNKLRDFKLIKEQPFKSDVFVQQNPQAVEIWNKVKTIFGNLKEKKIDLWEAKKRFEILKGDFYQYVVSVDVSKNQPFLDEELNIFYVPYGELENYYDPEMGFIREGKTYEEF